MSNDSVRIGIVGAGEISGYHLRALQQISRGRATAICDVEAKARKRAVEFGIPGVYTDYKQMLADADIDAVIVAVPNFLHHEVAMEALGAGKHVLCEKPMALNAAYAQDMVDAAHKAGRILAVGLVSRFARTSQLAKAMADRGELGDIYYAKAVKVRRKGIPGWGTWFTQKEYAGGGPVLDIGVHALDLAWYIMGTPRPVSVCGFTAAAFGPRQRGIGQWGKPNFSGTFDVEDMGAGIIRFANGAVINVETSWALNTIDQDCVTVMGEKAGISFEPLADKVTLYAEVDGDLVDTVRTTKRDTMDSIFLGEMKNFVLAVAGEEPARTPGEQGLAVTRMLEAIYVSSQTGREVRLD